MNTSPDSTASGKAVSRETLRRLEHFASLFAKWSSAINLVAPSTLSDLWERHIADSLQIFNLSPKPLHWIDLGSGAGFPGMITAICLADINDGWVDLIESNNKKAAFLRTAIRETGARASVHAVRIETASQQLLRCDRISARALADLDLLLGYIEPWMLANPDMIAFLHKGRDYRHELEVSHRRWIFDLVEHASETDARSVVLEISRLSRK